jgi:hypothetical protein
MRSFALGTAVVVMAGLAGAVGAQTWEAPGSLLGVSVEVEGRSAPLYAAVDGSGRFYVEARAGARYAIRLASRTGERLGVLVAVDGLNVVSGERLPDLSRRPTGLAGRLYVLDPWGETTIRGWRTSLDEVRRFTFVDERSSYATRSGKSNSKMGWIEVAVFRERRPLVWQRPYGYLGDPSREDARDKAESDAPASPGAGSAAKDATSERKARPSGPVASEAAPQRSYPGTGWGSRLDDRVVVVDFDPEETPSERHTLRYEYVDALYALGVLPRPQPYRDRLSERDRGQGFAPPPAW